MDMQPQFRGVIPVQYTQVSFLWSVEDKTRHTIIFDGLIFDGLIIDGLIIDGLSINWHLADVRSSRDAA